MKGQMRVVQSDLRFGVAGLWRRYLVILAVGAGLFAFMVSGVWQSLAAKGSTVGLAQLSFGDFFCVLFGGATERRDVDMGFWTIPAAWILVCALIFYLTLDYPYRDLAGMGKQLIVASGSRWGWWLSKCAWVIAAVLLAYALMLGACALATLCVGGRWVSELWEQVASTVGLRTYALIGGEDIVFNLSGAARDVSLRTWDMGSCLATIPLMLVALCLVQLTLSLLAGPLPAFGVSMATLLVSAWAVSPALLGNYLMVTRTTVVSTSGVDVGVGIAISIVLIIVSIVGGGLAFSRMDILGGERWAS